MSAVREDLDPGDTRGDELETEALLQVDVGLGGVDGRCAERGGVAEDAPELPHYFGADLEAIDGDAGADGGVKVIGTEGAHGGDGVGGDVGNDAAPAGVEGGD